MSLSTNTGKESSNELCIVTSAGQIMAMGGRTRPRANGVFANMLILPKRACLENNYF